MHSQQGALRPIAVDKHERVCAVLPDKHAQQPQVMRNKSNGEQVRERYSQRLGQLYSAALGVIEVFVEDLSHHCIGRAKAPIQKKEPVASGQTSCVLFVEPICRVLESGEHFARFPDPLPSRNPAEPPCNVHMQYPIVARESAKPRPLRVGEFQLCLNKLLLRCCQVQDRYPCEKCP